MPAKNWKDTNVRYNQQTKTIEKFLTDLRATKQINFSLESCNVCSTCCGIEAIGGDWLVKLPQLHGKNIISQADLMFQYIYSFPEGLPVKDNGAGLCENECIENLAFAVNNLSTAKAEYFYNNNNKIIISEIKELLKNNIAIVASYTDSKTPGHYICIVNYENGNFIYYDSWKGNSRNKNEGKLEKFSEKDLEKCIKHRYMKIYKS